MKHILKKLHIGSSHQDSNRSNQTPIISPSISPSCASDHRSPDVHSPTTPPSPTSSSPPVPSAGVSISDDAAGGGRNDFFSSEEEFQIQLAIAISVSSLESREDRDCEQIHAATLLSSGQNRIDSRRVGSEPAELLSRRYWDYNVIDYGEKVVDGFYDIYGLSTHSASKGTISSFTTILANLGDPGFEVVIVNRAIDPALDELLQIARCIALDCPATVVGLLVQRLADLVSEHMGGPVRDANVMLAKWMERSSELRASLHTCLFLIGSLNIGLSRHRALLFKLLADTVGVPCKLVKGSHYTGIDDDAVNMVKLNEREFLVDLMAAPGTLIPADSLNNKDSSLKICNPTPPETYIPQRANELAINLSKQELPNAKCKGVNGMPGVILVGNPSLERVEPSGSSGRMLISVGNTSNNSLGTVNPNSNRSHHLSSSHYNGKHVASSISHGVKEKQNVVRLAPHSQATMEDSNDLFADLNPFQVVGAGKICMQKTPTESNIALGSSRPPLPMSRKNFAAYNEVPRTKHYEFVEGLFPKNNQVGKDYNTSLIALTSSVPPEKPFHNVNVTQLSSISFPVGTSNGDGYSSGDQVMRLSTHQQNQMPSNKDNSKIDRVHNSIQPSHANHREECHVRGEVLQNDVADHTKNLGKNFLHKHEIMNCTHGRSTGGRVWSKDLEDSDLLLDAGQCRLDPMLDDVAELEIPWEHLAIGERIGLGSYGEVYHADWNGKEVAVKKFLDQDFFGDALDEFRSEVRIMRRLRHPNVVLFMGAVTRPPNLSIVTEFLPRGSLHRILHRPNCQIDEKRRIKMALDVAKGMNCLHTSIPTIVHRDLKSPNLLVDKSWNVKVCDFGLSRLKHNTFLSSRSTAGTPEWMAPEVLRNEPSNEKCDVYSFGVILWEIATLRLPWSGMNQMQVVGAVGFQNRRLDIPKELDPLVARMIWECWQTDPNLRPSFAQLSTALERLQRLVIPSNSEQQNTTSQQVI